MNVTEALTATPITKKGLAEKMGTDSRTVELAINAARLEGAPIVSTSEGYWLAADAAEVAACAQRLRRRAVTQLVTSRALRATARRMEAREAVPLAFAWSEEAA